MVTNKYYMLQGEADPDNMKRCSQDNGRSGPIKYKVYVTLKILRKTDFYSKTDAHGEFGFSYHDNKILLAFRVPGKRGSEMHSKQCKFGKSEPPFSPSPKTRDHNTPEIASVSLLLSKKGAVH